MIDDVTDIFLLGSAIYSQWRYFNHWAYSGEDILEPQNRAWFISAFSRLAQLSGEDDLHEVPEGTTWEFVTWDYTEHLIIDRKTETLEHIQNIGTGCRVSRKYEIEDGIESLLENFDAKNLFSHIEGNPDDVIESPNETRDYKITIDYKIKPQRVIEGSYDKKGLPEDFADFVETVFSFIQFYGMGEIFNPFIYGKVKRRKSDYIFCSVVFDEGYKTYYYLTDDDSIEIGDFVLVPAGKDNHEVIVEVVNIEYFSEENVPLPVEKTKKIIQKCIEDRVTINDLQSE